MTIDRKLSRIFGTTGHDGQGSMLATYLGAMTVLSK